MIDDEDAARAACQDMGWIDMRDDPESESMFFNERTEDFDFDCETWVALASQEGIKWTPPTRGYLTAILATAEIPFGTMIEEGLPLKDAGGNTIGEITGAYRDKEGRLVAKVHLSSIVADGLFETLLSVAEKNDG